MIRFFRLFVWLRWRVLRNSLERSGRRDTLERIARALQVLVPLAVGITLVPVGAAFGALGFLLGARVIGGPQELLLLAVARLVLLAVIGLALAGPLLLPGGPDAAGLARLQLLPVRRSWLYAAGLAAHVLDPWILVVTPLLLLLPVGAAWSGRLLDAGLTMTAGITLLLTLLALSSLATSVVLLALRNRRRAELLMVLALLLLPSVGLLVAWLPVGAGSGGAAATSGESSGEFLGTLGWLMPPELYARAVSATRPAHVLPPLGILAALGAVIQTIAWKAYRETLEPAIARRGRGTREAVSLWTWRLPGLGRAASCVALAHLRLILRTPRGLTVVLAPPLFTLLLVAIIRSSPEFAQVVAAHRFGPALAGVGAFVGVLALHPILLNQFAISRNGLTLEFLLPISDEELIFGRAVAGGLLAGLNTGAAIALTWMLLPVGPATSWLTVGLSAASCYFLLAPAGALLSVLFPRAASLDRVSSGSNPHTVAGLVGLATAGMAVGPPALLTAALWWRPGLAVAVLGGWTLLTGLTGWKLLRQVAFVLQRRRENLALVASAR